MRRPAVVAGRRTGGRVPLKPERSAPDALRILLAADRAVGRGTQEHRAADDRDPQHGLEDEADHRAEDHEGDPGDDEPSDDLPEHGSSMTFPRHAGPVLSSVPPAA